MTSARSEPSRSAYIVTGAASGIGAALVRKLLTQGARVAAADLNTTPLASLAQFAQDPSQLLSCALDVRQPEQWEAAYSQAEQRFGRIDALFNVAGVIRPGWSIEITPQDIDLHLDINTKGVMLGTALAARRMQAQGGGHIINIASLAGIAPVPGIALYSASKFAVRGFSLAVAQELAPLGIKVSVICPDAVQTPMLDLQIAHEQAAMTFSGDRFLTADEVVAACLQALERAPIEITLPPARGIVAKLASAFPSLNRFMLEQLRRKGLRKQQQMQRNS